MKISYKPVDSDYQVLIKKDYDSWASSLYSPEGFFKYEFPMSEFLIPTEGRTLHATENRLVITIECKMKNNKFYDFQITEHMKEKNLGITLKDIYENVIEHKLYIVHRLDKDTSGLMLFAKNRITASKISSLFLNNKIKKYYIAVTNTEFNKNTDTLINYNSDKKELKLAYKKIQLDYYDNCYLIKLFTGKKHQIRLQFYLNKNPIIGDKKFSGNKFNKLLLCSYKIIFELDGKFYKFKINPNKILS